MSGAELCAAIERKLQRKGGPDARAEKSGGLRSELLLTPAKQRRGLLTCPVDPTTCFTSPSSFIILKRAKEERGGVGTCSAEVGGAVWR